jgi:protein-tyrosine phosphatase
VSEPLAFVDLHNHLIPGVDDGARDLEDALAALEAMREQGVRRLVATPHIEGDLIHREEAFRGRCQKVDDAWELFRAAATERFPDVRIGRGHEIMMDVPRVQLADPRLRLGGSSAVLVEFPLYFLPAGGVEVVANLRSQGWIPVVAHPERYVNIGLDDWSVVEKWRRAGARMAVNAGSLVGGFGTGARITALQMLSRGWVDVIGSDYHARNGRRPLQLGAAYEELLRSGGEEQASLLFSLNPARLLDDQETLEVPPLILRSGIWDRLRRIVRR